jgi:hypothetical protein
MRKFLILGFLGLLLFVVGMTVGCSDSDTTAPQNGEGQLQIFMIDAPGDYDEVNVEVVEVRVHRADADSMSGWLVVNSDTTYVNLLELTDGNHCVLADTTLPAGHYSQIRLILGDGNNVVVDGETHDLRIPSSGQSGLKLIHGFTIEDGTVYGMTLDFDADRSIHRTGNGQYMMRPVIRLMVNALSGSLSGMVEPIEALAMITAVADTDTAVTYADEFTGSFHFPMLSAGTYDLTVSATAGAYTETVLSGVVVSAGQDSDLGTIVLQAE